MVSSGRRPDISIRDPATFRMHVVHRTQGSATLLRWSHTSTAKPTGLGWVCNSHAQRWGQEGVISEIGQTCTPFHVSNLMNHGRGIKVPSRLEAILGMPLHTAQRQEHSKLINESNSRLTLHASGLTPIESNHKTGEACLQACSHVLVSSGKSQDGLTRISTLRASRPMKCNMTRHNGMRPLMHLGMQVWSQCMRKLWMQSLFMEGTYLDP